MDRVGTFLSLSCYDRDTPHSRQVHIPFGGYKGDMISSYASPSILKRDPARRERWAEELLDRLTPAMSAL